MTPMSHICGMGAADPSTCGPNPCGVLDGVYASDTCVAYQCCVAPTSYMCTDLSQGAIAAGAQAVGSGITNLFGELGSGLSTGVGSSVSMTAIITLVAILVGGFAVYKMVGH